MVVDFTNNAKAILKAFAKYRKGTPFEPDEPAPELVTKLMTTILSAGVFAQKDADELIRLMAAGPKNDPQVQFMVSGLRVRFQAKLTAPDERKAFVYLLARFVKSFHFLSCFFSYSQDIEQFATFAEYVGPQLIKQGTVSELMKQIRRTEVMKASVVDQGVVRSGSGIKLRPGKGTKGAGPPIKKVSVQDMIDEIQAQFQITDEEALYIKQVTEEKAADPGIRNTVQTHREDRIYLEGPYRSQVNGEIQGTYNGLARYEELADPKYTDTPAAFSTLWR